MKALSAVLFGLGILLLGFLTVFSFSPDAMGVGALIQLGVWTCAFFLAAIWLKMGTK